ncbi:hypothetical protein Bpfe_015556 [Biomphalaria pfeifferi]|uniref:Uncharacterized protein n=1 Tax=Biomphalaria pfeifferi TaxID=112525 RepID=A0AAD8F886_BIOPF|nr:hypothetical protein Bpfe_015556 [Biomphalaria pfeifferi]
METERSFDRGSLVLSGDTSRRYHEVVRRINELNLTLSQLHLEKARLERQVRPASPRAVSLEELRPSVRDSFARLEKDSEVMRVELLRLKSEVGKKREKNEALLREIAWMKERLKYKPHLASGSRFNVKTIYSQALPVTDKLDTSNSDRGGSSKPLLFHSMKQYSYPSFGILGNSSEMTDGPEFQSNLVQNENTRNSLDLYHVRSSGAQYPRNQSRKNDVHLSSLYRPTDERRVGRLN